MAAASEPPRPRQKVIGIIGGSGPEAGMDLLGKVLRRHRRRLGPLYASDRDAPDVLLRNVPGIGGPRTAADLEPGRGTHDASRAALLDAVAATVPPADAVCVACHALHAFEDDVRAALASAGKDPAAFVSAVDVTARACRRRLDARGGGRLAILGVPPTMDLTGRSPYRRVLEELGAGSVHLPTPSDVEAVRRVIWRTKEDGRAPSDGPAREAYLGALESLASEGVTLCVLACTELPLVDVGDAGASMEFLDPTEALADALLEATQDYSEWGTGSAI